ncbi:protein VASCULAR ASSOCIATED DEATH 1, chloroplastic isoform X2 [Aristolochia californica]|uniref:protein VASCULAR ASSOCIATED DEATH 1, chloroplastic isoform X2 n=1 Tax=Aristolochia californica TaxID=171875 RepID=UPI0035DB9E92
MAMASEPSQSMDAFRLLSAKSDADTSSDTSFTSGFSAAGDVSDRIYRSDSAGRRDLEVLSVTSSRSEEYRQLFHLPPDETLVQDFNCAFQESILIQGHMYLFVRHICFYANIFGFETKKIIPLHEVICVRKAKTAGIFPNAIEIVSETKKHFFASFLSRDEAYRLIIDGWSQQCPSAKGFLELQEPKTESSSPDNVLVLFEKFKNFARPANELDTVERSKDADTLEECNSLSNCEDVTGVTSQLSEVKENGESDKADSLPCGVPLNWKPVETDAPNIPEYYTLVAEAKFPIESEEFFHHFFSDSDFVEAFHSKCGDKDFRCTEWYEHEQFGYARDVSFLHPIKIYLGARYGQCQEVQKFRVYRDSHLVIETSQQVNGVPYGDYFSVEGLWDVKQIKDDINCCCLFRVYVNVAFSRKTMWKGKIEQSTMEECREAYAVWINNAHELLKQRNLPALLKGVTTDTIATMPNEDIGSNSSGKLAGPTEGSQESQIPVVISNVVSKDGYNSVKGNVSLASLLREFWTSFCLSFKSQRSFTLVLLVILVLIFLLMQLSIVVLLTRSPKIHLIPQENFISGLSSDRTEALRWLEKRVHHLKEEMLMVEARLEKMRVEYTSLKLHLQGFEKLDSRA